MKTTKNILKYSCKFCQLNSSSAIKATEFSHLFYVKTLNLESKTTKLTKEIAVNRKVYFHEN